MARYDEHTEAFMRKIAGEPKGQKTDNDESKPPEESKSHHLTTKPLRVVRAIARGMEDPRGALGKLLVGGSAKYIMNKEGSLGILRLYEFLNSHYGREWRDWESETVWKTLQEDHFSEGTPEEIKEAILALQLTSTTMAPLEHWHVFEKVGHAFNLNDITFVMLQPLEPDEAALAMGIINVIQPKTEFEPEILIYVAVCAKTAGMVYLPNNMFPGVQKHLDDLTFEYDLRDRVRQLWDNPQTGPGITDAEKIQMERLQEIKEYLIQGGLGA